MTRTEIAAAEITTRAHRLNPNGLRNEVALGDLTGLTGLGCHLVTLPPGRDSTEAHTHSHEDEAAFVLEGTGEARIGAATYAIGPGDFVAYPKGGAAHVVTNTGNTPLVYLLVSERSPFDVVDYPGAGKRLYRRAGVPSDLVDIDAITRVERKPPAG